MNGKGFIETNWYVLTGGPGSGKTTTIERLAARGYKTTIEHARHYIQTQMRNGRTAEQVRKNQEEFQLEVLKMQMEEEAQLAPEETVFLDRALPDALAYYHFLKLPVRQELVTAIRKYRYKKVFILELLPLIQDDARKEDEKAQKEIHYLLIEVYLSMQIPVVHVPVLKPEERVDFILHNL